MTGRRQLALAALTLLAFGPALVRAQVGIVNGLTQEKICVPGETFESYIRLKNNGAREETVRVYQTDYSFLADGRSFYDAPGKLERSNAAWITFSPKQVTIPAAGTTDVKYSCRVPADAGRVGTYWSIIMFEVLAAPARGKDGAAKKEIAFGVSQVMRYGVQIVTHFGDSGKRSLKFLKTELIEDKGQKALQVDVENDGERWLRPFAYVEVYTEKGELAGKFEGERARIFPGTSARFKLDVSTVPAGSYNALIVFDNKDVSVFGAQVKLKIERGSDAPGKD